MSRSIFCGPVLAPGTTVVVMECRSDPPTAKIEILVVLRISRLSEFTWYSGFKVMGNALLNLPTLPQSPYVGLGSVPAALPPMSNALLAALKIATTPSFSLADLAKPQPLYPNALVEGLKGSTSIVNLLGSGYTLR